MSTEGIPLKKFSEPTHTETEGTPQACTHHAVFHSFFLCEVVVAESCFMS